MKTKTLLSRFFFASMLALLAQTAWALQQLEPVEGHNSFAKISAKESTRFVIQGGKIRQFLSVDGELIIDKDPEQGQVFVKPIDQGKPINIRIVSSSGATYSFILQPVDMPQEDIVIKDNLLKQASGNQDTKADAYIRGIRALMIRMAADEEYTNAKGAGNEYSLWEGTEFVHAYTYQERAFIGDKYRLKNTGSSKMRLAEQEFYRKGVLAVAIQNLTLDPGESTWVYVVRGNQ